MTLKRLQRIAIDNVRVSPDGTERPKIAIGSGTSGMGLHLRGHQLPHQPVAEAAAGGDEDEERREEKSCLRRG